MTEGTELNTSSLRLHKPVTKRLADMDRARARVFTSVLLNMSAVELDAPSRISSAHESTFALHLQDLQELVNCVSSLIPTSVRPSVRETAVRQDVAGTGVPFTWRSSDVMSREVRRLLVQTEPNLHLWASFRVFSVSKNKHRWFSFGEKFLLISASRDYGLDEKLFEEAAAAF